MTRNTHDKKFKTIYKLINYVATIFLNLLYVVNQIKIKSLHAFFLTRAN